MPIGPVHSSPHIRFSGMAHRATNGTPDGPGTRKAGVTASHFGNLSHWALVRDGVNRYRVYYGISEGKAKDRQGKLVEVINNDTHTVVNTIRVKRNSMVYVVNFETGNIIDLENPTNKQSYISRFNKDTFPKQIAYEIDITEVGFWTVFGNYWPPVKFNDDHFSKRELDREVGVLKEKQKKRYDNEDSSGSFLGGSPDDSNTEQNTAEKLAAFDGGEPKSTEKATTIPDPIRDSVIRQSLGASKELRPNTQRATTPPKPVPIDPFKAQMGSQYRLRDTASPFPPQATDEPAA